MLQNENMPKWKQEATKRQGQEIRNKGLKGLILILKQSRSQHRLKVAQSTALFPFVVAVAHLTLSLRHQDSAWLPNTCNQLLDVKIKRIWLGGIHPKLYSDYGHAVCNGKVVCVLEGGLSSKLNDDQFLYWKSQICWNKSGKSSQQLWLISAKSCIQSYSKWKPGTKIKKVSMSW